MAEQYDAIAADYRRTKESPLRRFIEAPTLFGMLGEVRGLRALDLACGEGFYTRQLLAAGAVAVTGVDISAEMIALAEAEEASRQQGIRYACADVAELNLGQRFDVVTAAYLLHYAPSKPALRAMCSRVARHLEPGGRFVAINENPRQRAADCAGYAQYGFNKAMQTPQVNGARIDYAMVSGRSMIRFHAYYYDQPCYEAALQSAGFAEIRWHELQLDPAGSAECGSEYFDEYLANPPIIGLECRLR